MPIQRPTSGQRIQTSHIADMHTVARQLVNGQNPNTLAPEALGPAHLPGLVLASDVLPVTANMTINVSPASLEIPANIIALWQNPASYRLNNGGLGYPIIGGCILFTYCTLRLGAFANDTYQLDHQVWANLYHVRDGVDQTSILGSRMIYGQVPAAGSFKVTEEPITILSWASVAAGFTLNEVGVRFALNRGASAGGVPNFDVPNGEVGFFALYQDT